MGCGRGPSLAILLKKTQIMSKIHFSTFRIDGRKKNLSKDAEICDFRSPKPTDAKNKLCEKSFISVFSGIRVRPLTCPISTFDHFAPFGSKNFKRGWNRSHPGYGTNRNHIQNLFFTTLTSVISGVWDRPLSRNPFSTIPHRMV